MQRRLCEMSEAKWSIAEAKCLQMSHNKYASQRDAISPLYGNLMLSHSAGMQHPDISIAGICPNKFERAKGSKRFHFASLHYIFSAYLPTHIKFLTEFLRIFFGTTCISFPYFIFPQFWQVIFKIICQNQGKYQVLARYSKNYLPKSRKIWSFGKLFTKLFAKTQEKRYLCVYLMM